MAITAPVDGDLVDPSWAADITAAVNQLQAYQTMLGVLAGAPSSYVPVFTGITSTGPTLTGIYQQVGKWVDFWWELILGTSPTIGTSPTFTLPVAMHSRYNSESALPFGGELRDAGVGAKPAHLVWSTSTKVTINYWSSTASPSAVTSGNPHTWGPGDIMTVWGRYASA